MSIRSGRLAAGLVLATTGWSSAAPPAPPDSPFLLRQLPAAIEPHARPVVEANTRFALDLYGELRTAPGNLFFSPFSTSIALAMTQAGAAGAAELQPVVAKTRPAASRPDLMLITLHLPRWDRPLIRKTESQRPFSTIWPPKPGPNIRAIGIHPMVCGCSDGPGLIRNEHDSQ